MFKFLIGALLVMAASAQTAQQPESRFRCNLNAMNPAERQKHTALGKQLWSAVRERTELPNGYGFRLDTDRISPAQVTKWMAMERKCCPFFDFELELQPEKGPVWMRLTGAPGVKDFIKLEFPSPSSSI